MLQNRPLRLWRVRVRVGGSRDKQDLPRGEPVGRGTLP